MRITIKTLQREFVTDPDNWLGSSRYFDNLFSEKWGDKQEDGSYFIETDADTFEHILRYLRTNVLPLFYDVEKGHDHALYYSLLGEANYFSIDRLEKWIRNKTYLDVVDVTYRFQEVTTKNGLAELRAWVKEHGNATEVSTTLEKRRKPLWYCRNNHDSSTTCVRYCHDKNGSCGFKEGEETFCSVKMKFIEYNHELCSTAFIGDG